MFLLPSLKERINDAVQSVTLDVLRRVWQEIAYLLDVGGGGGQQMKTASKYAQMYVSFISWFLIQHIYEMCSLVSHLNSFEIPP